LDYFAGSHTGYLRLADPVACRREIVLDRARDIVVVRDTLESAGTHRYTWRFHFDPALDGIARGGGLQASAHGKSAWLRHAPCVSPTVEAGWVSPRYGVKQPTRRAVFTREGCGTIAQTWVFATEAMTARDRAQHADALFDRAGANLPNPANPANQPNLANPANRANLANPVLCARS